MIARVFIFLLLAGPLNAQESKWSFGIEVNTRFNIITYQNYSNFNNELYQDLVSTEQGQIKFSFPVNLYSNYKIAKKLSFGLGIGLHQTGWKSPRYESLLDEEVINGMIDPYSAFQLKNNDYYLSIPIGGIYHIAPHFDFEFGIDYSYLLLRQQAIKKWYSTEIKRETEPYQIASNKHFFATHFGVYYNYRMNRSTIKLGISCLASMNYLNGENDLGRNFHQGGITLKYQWNK